MSEEDIAGGIADDPAPADPAADGGAAPADAGGIADDPAPVGDGKAAEPAGEAKPEDKPAEPEYELQAGEDFPMPEDNLKSFTSTCRKAGLTKEQAEAVLGWHRDQYKNYSGDIAAQQKQTLEGWGKEMAADKEFGGQQWKSTLADARRALSVADTDGTLRQLLRDSNYQHNPTVIRAIARMGRLMREDTVAKANGEGTSEKPLWDRIYDPSR